MKARFFRSHIITLIISFPIVLTAYTTQSTSQKPLLAFSLDYQGCLANTSYQKKYIQLASALSSESSKEDLSSILLPFYNLPLLGFLTSTIYHTIGTSVHALHPPVIFLNGSNRQFMKTIMYPIHSINYFKDAPIPIALQSIYNLHAFTQRLLGQNYHALTSIYPILLGDIYYKKEIGDTWRAAQSIDTNRQKINVNKDYIDRSKFDIVYTQVHQLALNYPSNTIQFYFFDDTQTILHNLKYFFKANPEYLPHNVILFLMHYDGNVVTQLATVQGKGKCDQNYRDSILYTYHQFRKRKGGVKLDKLSLLSHPEYLTAFKDYQKERRHNMPNQSLSVQPSKIFSTIQCLRKKLFRKRVP